ncbi:MAG: putative toxin-antitoxin system toxin component, PIN family [Cyanobacteria bacterium J06600_6]
MKTKIVIDTNVFIGALIGKQYSANRKLIELCLKQEFCPLMNNTLYAEYEDVIHRPKIGSRSLFEEHEINELFDAFLSSCKWIKIYYLWRPNLRDEKDNYLVELAVAGNANVIVTHNIKDFQQNQLKFPQIKIKKPQEII